MSADRMRALMATASAAALLAGPASAEPVTAAIAAGTIFGSTLAFNAVVSLGISLSLMGVGTFLTPTPSVPDLKRELSFPSSLPPWRFAYGRDRIYGSPAPWRVKGRWLFGCLILNSRPSAGGSVTIWFDKRPFTITDGDLFDFEGGGARGTVEGASDQGADAPRIWMGLGDQVSPPDWILAEAPELFRASDGWRGRTVLWVALNAGASKNRIDRWPSPAEPQIEVKANWSLVWDPSDPAQDPDDPATWTWSANAALCLLDALRRNPVRAYQLEHLQLESFRDAADVNAAAGFEAHGLLVWDGAEIVDQVSPLAAVGGGELVHIGSRTGYAAAAWRAPIHVATDILEDGGVDFQVLAEGREIPRGVKATYLAPDRNWEEAELPAIPVPGGPGLLGDENLRKLDLSQFCRDPVQAMRVQQIHARRLGAQKRLSCTLPPSAIVLVCGANVTLALPGGLGRLNGTYEVVSADPGIFLREEGGVALRVPVTLRETDPHHFDWNPETDLLEISSASYEGGLAPVAPPGDLLLSTGSSVARGTMARVRWQCAPAAGADGYEVEARISGETWGETRDVAGEDLDGSGLVRGHIAPASPGEPYDVRVRAFVERRGGRAVSAWRSASIMAQGPALDLARPTPVSATGGAGEITVNFAAPNSADYRGMEIWGADEDDLGSAVSLGTFYGAPNDAVTLTETGLGPERSRVYWARSRGPEGAVSAFSAPLSAVTDP